MQRPNGSRQLIRRMVIPAVVAGLLMQVSPGARAQDTSQLLQQQKEIQEKRAAAQDDLDRTTLDLQASQVQLQLADEELTKANDELSVIQNEYSAAEQELEQAETAVKEAEERYEEQKALLANRVRALSEEGRINYLAVLLGSTSFSDFVSRFDLLQLVVKKDAQLFAQVREEKKLMAERQQEAESRRNQAALLKAQTEEQHTLIASRQEERQQASRSLENQKRELLAQLDEMDRAVEDLQRQIWLAQQNANRPSTSGGFSPIPPVSSILITDPFGPRIDPVLFVPRFHYGTDFNAYMGQDVYAIESGVVMMAGWSSAGYGNLVIIDHGGGYSSWYGHSSQLLVSPGEAVQKGQVIAKAGSTGKSTGPHVHLEIHVNGQPVDPMGYL